MFDSVYFLLVLIGLPLLAVLALLYMTSPRKSNNLKNFPSKFAHRGLFNNEDIPENSMAAFKKAIDKGYGIELDIRLTKDLHLVVFHDDTLARLCKQIVKVDSLTLAELKKFTLLDSKHTVPTFAEFLTTVNGQVPILIEFKTELPGLDPSVICAKAAEMLSDYSGEYYIESFDYNVLKWFKNNQPHVVRGQLAMGTQCYIPALGKAHAEKIPLRRRKMMSYLLYNFKSRPHFIGYRYQDIHSIVKLNKVLGAKIACWTVTNKEIGDTLLQQYDSIIFEQYLA